MYFMYILQFVMNYVAQIFFLIYHIFEKLIYQDFAITIFNYNLISTVVHLKAFRSNNDYF